MSALLGSVFLASLAGSVHCGAMCGAFACAARGAPSPLAAREIAYHFARLAAYLVLGAAFGAVGAGLDAAAPFGWMRPAAAVAGVLLVLWGVREIALLFGARVPVPAFPRTAQRAAEALLRRGGQRSATIRAALLGALAPLLPCGWLYAFAATAGSTASPVAGATVMAAFWAGTVPALVAVSYGLALVPRRAQRAVPVVVASAMIVIGALTIAGAFAPTRATAHHHGSARVADGRLAR